MSTTNLVTSFADIEAKEIRWLWKPYIAFEKVTLVYGSRDVDIRQFLNVMAARASTGNLASNSEERNVLLVDTEKNPTLVKTQLEALGADMERIGFIPNCNLPTLLSAKKEIVESCIDVVIITTVEDMIYTKKDIKPVDASNTLNKLRVFASEAGCSIIIGSESLHQDKDGISRYLAEPIRRIPRSILSVTRNENIFTIKQEKNSLGKSGDDVEWLQQ